MTSTPHLNPALPDVKALSIHVDRLVVEGVRSFSSIVCDFYVSRTQDNDGLTVVLSEKKAEGEDIHEPMTLQISDSELELLLAHQPGLYLRSQRKWASQKAICDWLITRIQIHDNVDGNETEPSKYLVIDRNVPVPRSVENGSVDGAGNYKLKARQVGNEIILEAVPGEGVADGERPMSRVKIGLAEFQSLGALDSIPKDEGAFPSRPKGEKGERKIGTAPFLVLTQLFCRRFAPTRRVVFLPTARAKFQVSRSRKKPQNALRRIIEQALLDDKERGTVSWPKQSALPGSTDRQQRELHAAGKCNEQGHHFPGAHAEAEGGN